MPSFSHLHPSFFSESLKMSSFQREETEEEKEDKWSKAPRKQTTGIAQTSWLRKKLTIPKNGTMEKNNEPM